MTKYPMTKEFRRKNPEIRLHISQQARGSDFGFLSALGISVFVICLSACSAAGGSDEFFILTNLRFVRRSFE